MVVAPSGRCAKGSACVSTCSSRADSDAGLADGAAAVRKASRAYAAALRRGWRGRQSIAVPAMGQHEVGRLTLPIGKDRRAGVPGWLEPGQALNRDWLEPGLALNRDWR